MSITAGLEMAVGLAQAFDREDITLVEMHVERDFVQARVQREGLVNGIVAGRQTLFAEEFKAGPVVYGYLLGEAMLKRLEEEYIVQSN